MSYEVSGVELGVGIVVGFFTVLAAAVGAVTSWRTNAAFLRHQHELQAAEALNQRHLLQRTERWTAYVAFLRATDELVAALETCAVNAEATSWHSGSDERPGFGKARNGLVQAWRELHVANTRVRLTADDATDNAARAVMMANHDPLPGARTGTPTAPGRFQYEQWLDRVRGARMRFIHSARGDLGFPQESGRTIQLDEPAPMARPTA